MKVLFKISQRFLVEISSKLVVEFFELKTRRPSVLRLKYINEDASRSQIFQGLSAHSTSIASMRKQLFFRAVSACSLRVRRSRSDCAVGFSTAYSSAGSGGRTTCSGGTVKRGSTTIPSRAKIASLSCVLQYSHRRGGSRVDFSQKG